MVLSINRGSTLSFNTFRVDVSITSIHWSSTAKQAGTQYQMQYQAEQQHQLQQQQHHEQDEKQEQGQEQ